MSNLQIKVVALEVVTVPTAKGSYQTIDLTYRNVTFENKVETKKIMSFNHKDVFNTLKSAQAGDVYTVSRAKNDKGYWDWTAIAAGDAAPAATSASGGSGVTTTPAKSSFETAEERAKKQVYIVRQSSITAAIAVLKTDKKNPTVEEVINTAKEFEAYVFETGKVVPAAVKAIPVPVEDDDVPM